MCAVYSVCVWKPVAHLYMVWVSDMWCVHSVSLGEAGYMAVLWPVGYLFERMRDEIHKGPPTDWQEVVEPFGWAYQAAQMESKGKSVSQVEWAQGQTEKRLLPSRKTLGLRARSRRHGVECSEWRYGPFGGQIKGDTGLNRKFSKTMSEF